MMKDFTIDDLRTSDRNGLIDIIKSGTDYPYWYRKPQSDEAAAEEYIDRVRDVEAGKSNDLYKAIRTAKGRLIGCVYIDDFDKKTGDASLSYFLHKNYHGKGIGTDAVFEVVQSAVTNDGLKSLHATVHPKKVASIRILLSLGFLVTGYITEGPYRERDGSPAPRVVMKASERDLAAALNKHATISPASHSK